MTDREDAIYHSFACQEITILGAIERLRGLGYTLRDAEEAVCEWADELSQEDKCRK